MSKTPLQEVRECLLALDELAIQRQALLDQSWLIEEQSIELRGKVHKLINGNEHI